jgi:selenocysteine lyase/cysteine desulfurase
MENQKNKFQLKEGVSYINCAYMSPLLISSEKEGIKGMERKRNPFEIKQEDFFIEAEKVKENYAKIINSDSNSITICPSVSYGFATALNNISPNNKKKAIVIENEFPSGYFSAKNWCDKNECKLLTINFKDSDNKIEIINQDIINQIDEKTAFVLISSVHWANGAKFDLEKIGQKCKKSGCFLLVDGTQSIGALEMDVQKLQIDFMVGACYKWLFGPYSTAISYYSPSFFNGKPLEESWMNRTNAKDFSKLTEYDNNYTIDAGRFNVGEANDFIKMPMLNNALTQILEWKVDAIQSYCHKLMSPLTEFLLENEVHIANEKFQAQHIIGFKLPNKTDFNQLSMDLQQNQIFVSYRSGFLRVSPNVYNDSQDIIKLIEVLNKNL